MKKISIKTLSIWLVIVSFFCSCKKEWLDGKPNKSLAVPSTIADYQAILDNSEVMNQNYSSLYMLGDGDFYVTDSRYQGLTPPEMSAYVWADTKNFYGGQQSYDWLATYAIVLNTNVVLDGLKNLSGNQSALASFKQAKGSALFFRALSYFTLSQEFCKPYNNATASADLGLPLRTTADININFPRATLQATYDQVISDLTLAKSLLPNTQNILTRPSKAAAFGLLSRVLLSQQNYSAAMLYADSCLQINGNLVDYNSLNPSASFPIQRFNTETIFYYDLGEWLAFRQNRLIVDSTLYNSFNANDLRKTIFFISEGTVYSFKGSYDGDQLLYGGLATDEMYLTRAECYARAGNVAAALSDLNTLLKKRWVTGTYSNLTAANSDAALALILNERRKELCFRGLRWTDLRRLNTDTRFQTTLSRTILGQPYVLQPTSPKYVLPIDDYETTVGGLQQNSR